MRKIIDISKDLEIPLKVLAAAENKNLKNYIEDLLLAKVYEKKKILEGLNIELESKIFI
ncbi:MAG: hypothetical protein WA810_13215 [Maribacter sp.]